MLHNPTIEKLKLLKLAGMLKALEEQLSTPGISELDFFERFVLLVAREFEVGKTANSKTGSRQPNCGKRHLLRILTTAVLAVLTGALSPPCPPAVGSVRRM